MKLITRLFVFAVSLGLCYIGLRAAALGEAVPVAIGALLALCAAGLVVFHEREIRA